MRVARALGLAEGLAVNMPVNLPAMVRPSTHAELRSAEDQQLESQGQAADKIVRKVDTRKTVRE